MLSLLSFLTEQEGNNTWSTVILIVMIVAVVGLLAGSFFMQKKQRKKAEEQIKGLKIGDEIVTIGGIKGTIININESNDTMDIETGNGTVITFFKGAIQTLPNNQAAATAAQAPTEAEVEPVAKEDSEQEKETDTTEKE